MLGKDIIKHAREFARYIRNFQFEHTDVGTYFPVPRISIAGEYEDYMGRTPNLIPDEGLRHILDVAISDEAKLTNFYLGLYADAYTPVSTLTAATWVAAANEIQSTTEGYSGANRVAWLPSNPTAGVIDNYANKAAFTIVTATTLTIRGAALVSAQARGAGTGVIISAAKFATDRIENNNNVYNLGYRITATG